MNSELKLTDERFVPEMSGAIHFEHMHRYCLALDVARNKDVLDLACGEGYGSNMLSSVASSVVGVDVSSDVISHARNKYKSRNLSFLKGNCAKLPIASSSIDLVVSFETIEHHDEHELMMQEIVRVLRPTGVLIISSPNKKLFSDELGYNIPYHVKELYFTEFKDLLVKYFKLTNFYGQRAMFASFVVPLENEIKHYSNFDKSYGISHSTSSIDDKSLYFISAATNHNILPSLGTSTFEEINQTSCIANFNDVDILEARLYWRCSEFGGNYSEDCSVGEIFRLNGSRQTMLLAIPYSFTRADTYRLDLFNGIAAAIVHEVKLKSGDKVIWALNNCFSLGDLHDCVFVELNNENADFVCISISGDPQINLKIPAEISSMINFGAFFEITITPFKLFDFISKINSFIPQRNSAGALYSASALSKLQDNKSLLFMLKDLSNRIENELKARDIILHDKNLEILALRDCLIRAEAQLDLLKDVFLPKSKIDTL